MNTAAVPSVTLAFWCVIVIVGLVGGGSSLSVTAMVAVLVLPTV